MSDNKCITCNREIPPSRGNKPRQFCPAPDGQKTSRCARIRQRILEVDKLVREAELDADGLAAVRSFVVSNLVNTSLHAGRIAKQRRQEALAKRVPVRDHSAHAEGTGLQP